MSEPPDYARLAASILKRDAAQPRSVAAPRDRGIGTVANAIVERRRRKALRRASLIGLGAAAAVLAFVGAFGFRGPEAGRNTASDGREVVSPKDSAIAGGRAYPPGSRIRATTQVVSVQLGAVTRVDVERESEVVYESAAATRRFRLVSGSIRLRVEKLAPGERFIVETPDSEVEVRGTSFQVTLLSDPRNCATTTRVNVFEGTVEVRFAGAKHTISSGGHWPHACEQAVPTKVPAPVPSVAPRLRARSSNVPESAPSPSSATPRSALAAQNDLYAQAMAQKRKGSPDEAARTFERLISTYPGGPLEESAILERMRIFAATRPSRAAQEARRYLARFPEGFGRREAELLSGKP